MMKLTMEPDYLGFSEQLESFMDRHRHCFVWKRNSYLKVSLDINPVSAMQSLSRFKTLSVTPIYRLNLC